MHRWALVVVTLWSSGVAPVHAQAPLEESLRRYAEADFRGALAALDDAERGDDLSRDDLLRSLELRANLSFALGEEEGARAALRALAAIAPEHPLSEDSPPELHAMLLEARRDAGRGLRVRVAATTLDDGGGRLRATLEGAPEELARRVSIVHRAGEAPWERGPDEVELEASATRVEYYAIVIGPGGAVIAADASERSPRVWQGRGAPGGGADPLALGLGIAGGVLVVAAIIAIVAGASVDGSNSVSVPAVTW